MSLLCEESPFPLVSGTQCSNIMKKLIHDPFIVLLVQQSRDSELAHVSLCFCHFSSFVWNNESLEWYGTRSLPFLRRQRFLKIEDSLLATDRLGIWHPGVKIKNLSRRNMWNICVFCVLKGHHLSYSYAWRGVPPISHWQELYHVLRIFPKLEKIHLHWWRIGQRLVQIQFLIGTVEFRHSRAAT